MNKKQYRALWHYYLMSREGAYEHKESLRELIVEYAPQFNAENLIVEHDNCENLRDTYKNTNYTYCMNPSQETQDMMNAINIQYSDTRQEYAAAFNAVFPD